MAEAGGACGGAWAHALPCDGACVSRATPFDPKFWDLADLMLPILPVAAVCVHEPSIGSPRI